MSQPELRAQEYETHEQTLQGWAVRVITYRIGDMYYASIESVDPGAPIARAQGRTHAEALGIVRQKAAERLARTRRF
ncbi:MAG: hypothetical protein ACRENP_18285 [Longimicrobiales bacterium]